MKLLKILLLILAPVYSDALLENFSQKVSTWRNNSEGFKLFDVDNVEQPGQIASVSNGIFETKVPDIAGRGVHINFTPRSQSGYNGSGGRLRDYILDGNWDANFNRLSFLIKTNRDIPRRVDGGPNFQIGTYVHGPDYADPDYAGVRYYHSANMEIKAGAWYRVTLTRLPQDKAGANPSTNWPENPEYNNGAGPHYFEGMTKFSLQSIGNDWQGSTVQVADFRLSKEPEGQDDEIGTLVYGYSGSAYVLTWAGRKGVGTTYQIGYSTSPISSWADVTYLGNSVAPGNIYSGVIFRKANAELASGVYFAIRPLGQDAFTQVHVPYQMAPVKDTVVVPPPDTLPPVCLPRIVHDTVYLPSPLVRIDTMDVGRIVLRALFQVEP